MNDQKFRVNRYAARVAIVRDIYRTEDHRYVEIYGIWADDRTAFRNQFVPFEMLLEVGDPVDVIEQVAGPGRNQDAWVAVTSDSAPRNYPIPNVPAKRPWRVRDVIADVPNVALELAAIAAVALLGWQYRWWAAVLAGSAMAGRAWIGRFRRYQAGRRLDLARADEAMLFAEVPARLLALQLRWNAATGAGRRAAPEPEREPEPEPEPAPTPPDGWRAKLRLGPDCSRADAESAYRRALKECHPDLHMHLSARMQELAKEEARSLNAAIEQARRHFDQTAGA